MTARRFLSLARSPVWVSALGMLAATALACGLASGASSSVVVSMDVPSAVSMTNACVAAPATEFGSVLPGTSAITSSAPATACHVTFSSSNDSPQLRIGMSDRSGPAMSAPAYAWNEGRIPASPSRMSITAYDSLLALAGDTAGNVARTTDGGLTWLPTNVIGGDWVFDVEFVPATPDRWVAVGGDGHVSSSTNVQTSAPGAPTWNSHQVALLASGWPAGADVHGVAPTSDLTWVVSGEDGWVARTINGGTSFTSYRLGTDEISDVDAVDGNTIYGASLSGTLWRSATGGPNAGDWTPFAHPNGNSFVSLAVGSSTYVYALSASGLVTRWNGASFVTTTNVGYGGADAWSIAASKAEPATSVIVGTRGTTWKSTDAWASSWTTTRTPLGNKLRAVSITGTVPTSRVLAVGSGRYVARSDDATATWTSITFDAAAPALHGVSIDPADGRRAIAVGSNGTVLRTTNSGGSWNLIASGTTANLYDVKWLTSSMVVAVGSGGTILRSTDGGASWTAPTSPTTLELGAVFAGSDWTVWAVGEYGTILRSTNAGSTWTAQVSGTTDYLLGGAASDVNTAIVVGGSDRILRTTTGGSTWTQATSMPVSWAGPRDVAYVDGYLVLVTRLNNTWRSTDGGANWVWWGTGWGGDAIGASGRFLATSEYYATRYSRDGGLTWSDSGGSPNSFDLTDIAVGDGNTLYTTSESSVIGDSDESSLAQYQVKDYGTGGSSFATGDTNGTFAVCLQSLDAGSSASAGWTVDPGGSCTATDADPWTAIPAASTALATTTPANAGGVKLVWGVAMRDDQPPGSYSAGVTFEAIAPALP